MKDSVEFLRLLEEKWPATQGTHFLYCGHSGGIALRLNVGWCPRDIFLDAEEIKLQPSEIMQLIADYLQAQGVTP